MITAQVKSITTTEHSPLEDIKLQGPECFDVVVRAIVGPRGQAGEESFDIRVCTPSWLARICEKDGFVLGRHCLIVSHWDPAKIKQVIIRFIERCSGHTWKEVGEKVARLGHWEFEDYQPKLDKGLR